MLTFAPAAKETPLALWAASRVTLYVPAVGKTASTVAVGTPELQLAAAFQLPLAPPCQFVVDGAKRSSSDSNQIRYVDTRALFCRRRSALESRSPVPHLAQYAAPPDCKHDVTPSLFRSSAARIKVCWCLESLLSGSRSTDCHDTGVARTGSCRATSSQVVRD